MDKTGVSSYDNPPAYSIDFQPMSVSSPGAAAVPVPSVYPMMPTQQVTVPSDVGGQVVAVPLVQSYVSHIVLACFTFWFCGFVCGLIAFILAGAPISIYRDCVVQKSSTLIIRPPDIQHNVSKAFYIDI